MVNPYLRTSKQWDRTEFRKEAKFRKEESNHFRDFILTLVHFMLHERGG
jgi:hypothetical protein